MRSQQPRSRRPQPSRAGSATPRPSRQGSEPPAGHEPRWRRPFRADPQRRSPQGSPSSIIVSAALILIILGLMRSAAAAPGVPIAEIETPRSIPISSPAIPSPTSTLPPAAPDALCPEWWAVARAEGWEEEHLGSLDLALWRESRCDPQQHNASDPGSGSYGLLQINSFWCEPSRYWPDGYLQAHGILGSCSDLYRPETALRAGLTIYRYAEENSACGWEPWATMTCP